LRDDALSGTKIGKISKEALVQYLIRVGLTPHEIVAAGFIGRDCKIHSGHNILKVWWDAQWKHYKIKLKNRCYEKKTHITLVTPLLQGKGIRGFKTSAQIAQTDGDGNLIVQLRSLDPQKQFTPVKGAFSFVTYYKDPAKGRYYMSPPCRQVANVADFGAFPTSGKDETKHIQACIDSEAPVILISTPGVYLITFIELCDKQTLRCVPGVVLKLPDNHVHAHDVTNLSGIGAKDGIEWCAIDYVEYDGNAVNNRNWGSGWNNWDTGDYDSVHAHGLTFGRLRGIPGLYRTPPKRVYIGTAIVHDVVRNNLLWGAECELIADNLILKNSDADHLIYMSPTGKPEDPVRPAIINKAVLAGHWRGCAVVSNGISFGTVIVRDIEANPTAYYNKAIFMERALGLCGSTYGSVFVYDLDPAKLAWKNDQDEWRAQIFWIVNPITVNSIYIRQESGSEKLAQHINVDLVYTHAGFGVCNGTFINNYKLDGVQSRFVLFRQQGYGDKEKLKEKLEEEQRDLTLPTLKNVCFRNGHVEYSANSNGIPETALFNFATDTRHFIVDGLYVTHGPNGYHLLMAQASNWEMTDLYFRNISMPNGVKDIVADAKSGGVKISDSRFSSNDLKELIICGESQDVVAENVETT
jgi:hypothetical protein